MITLERWNRYAKYPKVDLIKKAGIDSDLSISDINYVIKNLTVFTAFVKEAHRARRKGLKRFSARAILHYLRWETALSDSGEAFKISNRSSAIFSRMTMTLFPILNGYFVTRGRT